MTQLDIRNQYKQYSHRLRQTHAAQGFNSVSCSGENPLGALSHRWVYIRFKRVLRQRRGVPRLLDVFMRFGNAPCPIRSLISVDIPSISNLRKRSASGGISRGGLPSRRRAFHVVDVAQSFDRVPRKPCRTEDNLCTVT